MSSKRNSCCRQKKIRNLLAKWLGKEEGAAREPAA